MQPTTIRIAELDDLAALHNLEQLCFLKNRQNNRDSIKRSIESRHQIVLILNNEETPQQILGSAVLYRYRETLRIYSISIHPDVRGQGCGDSLMDHILALAKQFSVRKLTLEVDASDARLMTWYQRRGFLIDSHLFHYYGSGEHGYRMQLRLDTTPQKAKLNVVVVDTPKKWKLTNDAVEVISAETFLTSERFRNSDRYHILNLCNSYKTHSMGYYVSLLASARNQRVIPSVMALKDIDSLSIAQSVVDEIKDVLEKKLKPVSGDIFELPIILGRTLDPEFSDLAKKLSILFEIPFLHITFGRKDTWKVRKINNLNLSSVEEKYPKLFTEALDAYFQKKRFRRTQLKKHKYDLAILIDPQEKTPPSSPEALEKFRHAAENIGFFVEFISKIDYRRICEFDAMFIRETTAIESHTYRMARHAHTEGLVVIDDPWSIMRCSNKIYLHERLARAHIQQPQSWLITKGSDLKAMLLEFTYPLVLKLPESSFSQGVYRVSDGTELKSKLQLMFQEGDLVIAQEFLKSNFDWRIGVLDGSALFACKYYMANEHWQIYNWNQPEANDEFSGKAEAIPINQVPSYVLKAALKSSALIGDGLYGVDIKEIDGQAYIIEINDNPNIDTGVEDQILGDELYQRIMTSLYNRIERQRNEPQYLI